MQVHKPVTSRQAVSGNSPPTVNDAEAIVQARIAKQIELGGEDPELTFFIADPPAHGSAAPVGRGP